MDLSWDRQSPFLLAGTRQIPCWCKVRNELNGLRPRKDGDAADLFCASPPGAGEGGGPPSMPRIFPVGAYKITVINDHSGLSADGSPMSPYLYPFWIGTDAEQQLDVWELDDGGHYLRKTGEQVQDTGYGLHFSSCDWTQGCIRIATKEDLLWLVANVKPGDNFIVTDSNAA